jgi:hypothetical protein
LFIRIQHPSCRWLCSLDLKPHAPVHQPQQAHVSESFWVAAQQDISSPPCHVGGDGDRAGQSCLRYNLWHRYLDRYVCTHQQDISQVDMAAFVVGFGGLLSATAPAAQGCGTFHVMSHTAIYGVHKAAAAGVACTTLTVNCAINNVQHSVLHHHSHLYAYGTQVTPSCLTWASNRTFSGLAFSSCTGGALLLPIAQSCTHALLPPAAAAALSAAAAPSNTASSRSLSLTLLVPMRTGRPSARHDSTTDTMYDSLSCYEASEARQQQQQQ